MTPKATMQCLTRLLIIVMAIQSPFSFERIVQKMMMMLMMTNEDESRSFLTCYRRLTSIIM